MTQEDINGLDAGIRKTVLWLNSLGFKTCDSGDGSKAETMECARDYPHVVVQLDDPEALVHDTHVIVEELSKLGLEVLPISMEDDLCMQASYDPATGSAFIDIMHISDVMLPPELDEQALTSLAKMKGLIDG
jgi:hypothetical protein